MSHVVLFVLIVFFPKRKVLFEVAFHGNEFVTILLILRFFVPFIIFMKGLIEIVTIVTFYFMTVFFLGMSISNTLAHIRSSSLLSQFHAKVSKIGWNLDVGGTNSACIEGDTVCCYYLLESYRA